MRAALNHQVSGSFPCLLSSASAPAKQYVQPIATEVEPLPVSAAVVCWLVWFPPVKADRYIRTGNNKNQNWPPRLWLFMKM